MTCPLGLGSLVYKKKKKCSYLKLQSSSDLTHPSKQLVCVPGSWEMG